MNRNAFSRLIGRAPFVVLGALALMVFSARPLCAQVDTGTILGTVTDTSGAPIHGAHGHNHQRRNERRSVSDHAEADGSYKFTPVRIGSYKLTATFTGFHDCHADGCQR